MHNHIIRWENFEHFRKQFAALGCHPRNAAYFVYRPWSPATAQSVPSPELRLESNMQKTDYWMLWTKTVTYSRLTLESRGVTPTDKDVRTLALNIWGSQHHLGDLTYVSGDDVRITPEMEEHHC